MWVQYHMKDLHGGSHPSITPHSMTAQPRGEGTVLDSPQNLTAQRRCDANARGDALRNAIARKKT
jgi:hypothetical protein